MDEVKRRPGRPKGSEIDDSVPLMAMTRLLMDDPKLAPKTAARRVFKASGRPDCFEDASIHRWQGKWKTDGESYKQRVQAERAEAERAKATAEAERQRRQRAAQSTHAPSAWDIHTSIYGYVPTSAFSRAVETMSSPALRSATDFINGAAAGQQPALMKTVEEPAWMKTERTFLEIAVIDKKWLSGGLHDPLAKYKMSAAERAAFDFGCMPKLPKGF